LKIHQESQEAPIYELRVADSGIEFKASVPGGCAARDELAPRSMFSADGRGSCGAFLGRGEGTDKQRMDASAVSLEGMASMAANYFCRQVIDRTGLTGKFDFHLVYLDDQGWGCAADPRLRANPGAAPAFVIALEQQLGLEPVRGQRGIVVVDRVERPVGN
jgi:uncharacterized protein (TIGR03435 family)